MVNTKIRLIIFFATKDREALYSQQKQDHELLIAKFILKLKKVGKTTRPFSLVQFSSVAQSCPTLCDPMNRSMPSPTPSPVGEVVHHQLPDFTQTHIH